MKASSSGISDKQGISGARKRLLYVTLVALYPVLVPSILSASVFLFSDIGSLRTVGNSTEFASIDYPSPDTKLSNNFKAKGKIKKLVSDREYYLATNNDDLFWPKTKLDRQSDYWEYSFSIKPGTKFNITVISVNRSGATQIESWFKNGAETGNYPALKNISGVEKVAQVTVEK